MMASLKLYLDAPVTSSKGPRYDVHLGSPDGEVIVRRSFVPLLDSARALAAVGLTSGEIELWDSERPFPRISGKIERLARLSVIESDAGAFRFARWKPHPLAPEGQKSPSERRGVAKQPQSKHPPLSALRVPLEAA